MLQELDDAVKSRLSFDSLGSMSMWPSHFAEKATLEHLAQENKELRHKIDSSQAMTSYRNMLRHWDERSTVYVGPDRAIAKVCNQLAFENQKQAEQIASMSAQLSMSGNASAADAMLVGQATSDPGYEWRRQHAVEGDIPEVQQGTKDLSSMTLQLPTVLKAAKTSPNGQVRSSA